MLQKLVLSILGATFLFITLTAIDSHNANPDRQAELRRKRAIAEAKNIEEFCYDGVVYLTYRSRGLVAKVASSGTLYTVTKDGLDCQETN